MKWQVVLLVAMLAVGALKLIKDASPSHSLSKSPLCRTATAKRNRFLRRRSNLGASPTMDKFKEILEASAKQKEKMIEELSKKKKQNVTDPVLTDLFSKTITQFSGSTSLEADEGVDEEDMEEYIKHLVGKLGIRKADRKVMAKDITRMVASIKSKAKVYSVVLKREGSKNLGQFFSILAAKNEEDNEYDFLIINTAATFMLEEEVIAVSEDDDSLWDTDSPAKVEIIKKEVAPSPETLAFVLNYLKLVAYEKLTDFLR